MNPATAEMNTYGPPRANPSLYPPRARETQPEVRRRRAPPRPDRLSVRHLEGRRRGDRGRHPLLPAREGVVVQGAQARAVLRRRRDPHDHQRDQGPRRGPTGPRPPAPRRPKRSPMTSTEPADTADETVLDTSDLDQHMGVPMEPGDRKS